MALAATQMALDDAAFEPEGKRPVPDERDHGQLVRRQRVRAAGDPEPVGQGADLRRRLPVDRLVLRGHDRPDLDQARHEGTVRRRRRRRRRRARGALAARGGRSGEASTSSSAAAPRRRSARTRSRASYRTAGSVTPPRPPTPTARSTPARTAMCLVRAARSSSSRGSSTAQERDAPQIYGEIIGYGATNDAHDAKRAPARRRDTWPVRCRSRSGVPASARTRSTRSSPTRPGFRSRTPPRQRRSGRSSARAPTKVPVTAPKSMTGRLYAGGASLDVAAAALAMRDGVHSADDQPRRAGTGLRARLRGGIGERRVARHGPRERAGLRRVQRGDGAPPRRRTDSLTRMAVASQTTACRIDSLLAETVRRHPARTALVWGGSELDYRSLGSAAEQLAERMLRSGSLRGARVVIIAPNVPALVVALFATWMLEAVAVPLSARLREHEIRRILEDAEPTLVLSVDAHLGFSFRELLRRVAARVTDGAERPLSRPRSARSNPRLREALIVRPSPSGRRSAGCSTRPGRRGRHRVRSSVTFARVAQRASWRRSSTLPRTTGARSWCRFRTRSASPACWRASRRAPRLSSSSRPSRRARSSRRSRSGR